MRNARMLRALSLLMIAALLLGCLPGAALAESFNAKVKVKNMYVLSQAAGGAVVGKLPKGTVVKVTAYADGVAQIKYRGYTGYAKVSDMKAVKSGGGSAAAAALNASKGKGKKAVALINTRVYSQPDTKSASVKVKAGTAMTILAVKSGVAMVKKGGSVGYVKRKHLVLKSQLSQQEGGMTPEELEKLKKKLEKEQEKEDQKNKLPDVYKAFKSGKYSNEQLCYLFLRQVMGYNRAAAAGVLANINYESGFRTGCIGDGGTSYGICQWHASRKTRLKNYCETHGVDPDTLAAQLAFLKYELETFYPSVHRYLKGVDNSAQGAYDAAYYFCYNFEAPAARVSQSVTRGQSAQKTYYPRYAKL